MSNANLRQLAGLIAAGLVLAACSGSDGGAGPPGPQGPQGPQGPVAPGAVGVGLKVNIVSATAPAAGPATVTFTVTDEAGTPIDFLAELAVGAFGSTRGPRFSIAQASVAGGSYDQALYEGTRTGDPSGPQSAGTQVPGTISLAVAAANYTANADGTYTFTFPTTTAQGLPALATGFPIAPVQDRQTLVGIQASRTFGGKTYPAGASFQFVPTGAAVTPRSVVSDSACNVCHKHLTAHGSRRTVGLCLTCHTPGYKSSASASSGATANAIDFRVMIHQIHRGEQPTDVQNASPWHYQWGATGDFSHVKFAPPNTVRNCVVCHQGGAQSTNWKTNPSRTVCSSCHYAVNFVTGVGHGGGPCTTETTCGGLTCQNCHAAEGPSPAIEGAHSPLFDAITNTQFEGRDLSVTIDAVNVTSATSATVTFTVKLAGVPVDLAVNPISSLRFTVAGPTSDYGGPNGPVAGAGVLNHTVGYVQSAAICSGTPAVCAGGGLTPTATAGQYRANLPNLTTAIGQTVGVGVEAYLIEAPATCGSPPCATREWAMEPLPATPTSPTGVIYARVGGGTATPRRLITDAAKCNACHIDLGFHGGEARKGPDYCAMCHNSRNVNDERTSQFEVDPVTLTTFVKTPGTVQLAVMIHKIHKGSEAVTAGSLPAVGTPGRPIFTLGATRDFRADPATGRDEGEAPPVEFAGQFPGDIMDCQTCHIAGGYGLPEANVLPTRFVTFTCKEAPGADADAICGTFANANGGVVVPDSAAGDANWTKTETFVGSGQAHCGSCHDSTNAITHFSAMTVNNVESCDVCHGDGRFMDPIEIHVGRP